MRKYNWLDLLTLPWLCLTAAWALNKKLKKIERLCLTSVGIGCITMLLKMENIEAERKDKERVKGLYD